jgi:hypothetical protein
MELFLKPASIGELLDRGVKLYRRHFVTAYLLMLIFFAPVYFVQNMLMFGLGDASFLPQEGITIAESLDRLAESETGTAGPGYGVAYVLFTFLVLPIYAVAVLPFAISSLLHVVRAAAAGEEIRLGAVLKRSFVPYWRVAGNTFLYGLILIGTYIAIVIAGTVLVFVAALMAGLLGAGIGQISSNAVGAGIAIIAIIVIAYVLFIAGVMAAFSFVLIRFGFYLPVLTLDEGDQPLQRSWRLTKGSFWRLFFALLVLTAISTIFAIGGYALLIAVFKFSIIGQIVHTLLALLVLPLFFLTFGAIYYELKGRTEGADIARTLALAQTAGSMRENGA